MRKTTTTILKFDTLEELLEKGYFREWDVRRMLWRTYLKVRHVSYQAEPVIIDKESLDVVAELSFAMIGSEFSRDHITTDLIAVIHKDTFFEAIRGNEREDQILKNHRRVRGILDSIIQGRKRWERK